MRLWQSGLLGAAAIALTASGALAQGVEWHDDGTVEYDAFMVGAFWYGDIAPAGFGFPIGDLG